MIGSSTPKRSEGGGAGTTPNEYFLTLKGCGLGHAILGRDVSYPIFTRSLSVHLIALQYDGCSSLLRTELSLA